MISIGFFSFLLLFQFYLILFCIRRRIAWLGMGGATHSSRLSFGESNLVRRSFTIEAVSKMNHFNLQQIVFAAGREMRDSASIADRKEPVVCPRPRRVSLLSNNQGKIRVKNTWTWEHAYHAWGWMTTGVLVTSNAGIKRSRNIDNRTARHLLEFCIEKGEVHNCQHSSPPSSPLTNMKPAFSTKIQREQVALQCHQEEIAEQERRVEQQLPRARSPSTYPSSYTAGHRRCDLLYLHLYTAVRTIISTLQRYYTPHHRRPNLTWTKTPPMASAAAATTITAIIAVDKVSQPLIVIA